VINDAVRAVEQARSLCVRVEETQRRLLDSLERHIQLKRKFDMLTGR